MAVENYLNDYSFIVAGSGITSGGTLLTVSATASISSGFRILVGTELMQVTAGGTTTTWTVTRGVEGTGATAHSFGDAIHVVLTAAALDNLRVQMSGIGTFANLPASGMKTGDKYKCTDIRYEFIYDGSVWQPFYDGLNVTTPPAASTLTSSMNASTVTLTTEYNGISAVVVGTGSGTENWGFVGKAYPSSSFTFTVGFQVEFLVPITWSYFGIGATNGLTTGTSAGIVAGGFFGQNPTNGFQLGTAKYDNTSSYNANYGSQITSAAPPATSGIFFVRWIDDLSSTRKVQFSHDMLYWEEFPGIQGGVSRTDFLTPTELGLIFGQSVNSTSASFTRYRVKIIHWTGF